MKTKSKVLVSALLVIALCASVIAGTTFALFSSEDKVNIAVTSGKVDVEATVVESSLELTSLNQKQSGKTWANGGKAVFGDKADLSLYDITPGDGAAFTINVINNSSINIQYKLSYEIEGILANVLDVTVTGASADVWTDWTLSEAKTKVITVSVALPENVGNDYQDKSANILFAVEAIQGNAETPIINKVATAESFDDAVVAARTSETPSEIVLTDDMTISQEIYLNGAQAPVTIDGKGHTLTVADGFDKRAEGGQYNLLKIYNTGDNLVTLKNITLQHVQIDAGASYHALDIHTAGNVVLQDVTLIRNVADGKGGAPLVINNSSVTVKGQLNLVAGGNSWYGANVDNSTLTIDDNATVSYLDVEDAYTTRAALLGENGGKVVYKAGTLIETKITQDDKGNPVDLTAYQVAVAKVGNNLYPSIDEAIAAVDASATHSGTVTLCKDVVVNTTVAVYGTNCPNLTELTLDGNGYTVSASEYFHMYGTSGQYNLMRIYQKNNITVKNINLIHRALDQNGNNYHALDIHTSQGIVLENVSLTRDFTSVKGGAPLVVNNSEVIVKGELNLTIGGNAWYGLNVSQANAHLTISDDATVNFVTHSDNNFVIFTDNGGVVDCADGLFDVTTVNGVGVYTLKSGVNA